MWNRVWITCKDNHNWRRQFIATFVLFYSFWIIEQELLDLLLTLHHTHRRCHGCQRKKKKKMRRMNNRYRKCREIHALHESCASSLKSHLSNCISLWRMYRRFPSRVAKLPDAIRISRVVKCGYAVNRSENFDDVPNCLRYTTPFPLHPRHEADGSNFGAIMCCEQCPRCKSMCAVRVGAVHGRIGINALHYIRYANFCKCVVRK